jgi:hypothetical protein
MTPQLEADLRAAFAQRASEVPRGAGDRLRQIDYRPRSRRVRPPMAFGALAGAAGTAAVAASIVGLGAASSAFAGWTSTPTTASGTQTAAADAACESRLAALPSGSSAAGMTPVLTDTRGPFTVVIFAGASGRESCISSPSFTAVIGSTPGAGGSSSASSVGSRGPAAGGASSLNISGSSDDSATVPAAQLALDTLATSVRDGSAFTVVEGRAGTDVTGATLVLADGRQVTASTAKGWFAAWWPGAQRASEADIATPTGVTTQHLDTGGPVQCGPGPCTRPPAGGSGASTNVVSGGRSGGAALLSHRSPSGR